MEEPHITQVLDEVLSKEPIKFSDAGISPGRNPIISINHLQEGHYSSLGHFIGGQPRDGAEVIRCCGRVYAIGEGFRQIREKVLGENPKLAPHFETTTYAAKGNVVQIWPFLK